MTLKTKFRTLAGSFYSAPLYRDVIHRWTGIGFSYMFFLVCMIITPALLMLILLIDRSLFNDPDHPQIENIAQQIIAQMPTLQFDHGVMSVDAAEDQKTITISLDGHEIPFIRLDSTANEQTLINSEPFLLITRDALWFKKMGNEAESRLWSEIIPQNQYTLGPDNAQALADEGIAWLKDNRWSLYLTIGVFLWAITVLAFYVYRVFEALLLALIAMVAQSTFKTNYDYAALVRLTCVAMTPAILLDLFFLGIGLGGISIFMFAAVTLGYIAFGLHSSREA